MVWYQFAWLWIKTGFSFGWAVFDVVATLLVLALAYLQFKFHKLQGSESMNKMQWRYPITALIICISAGMIVAPYTIYNSMSTRVDSLSTQMNDAIKQQKERQDALDTSMNTEVNTLDKEENNLKEEIAVLRLNNPATKQQIDEPQWQELGLKLSDIKMITPTVTAKIISDCDIFGKGQIQFTHCNFTDCEIHNSDTPFLEINNTNLTQVFGFDTCVFKNCRFWDVTICGTADQITQYKTIIVVK
jgi:hypothetical protein